MFKNKFPFGKVSLAFVIGAVAGAAAAFLLTPYTGKKMQKKVMDVVEDQYENVEKIVKKVVNA
jgi:gas vesicle protein